MDYRRLRHRLTLFTLTLVLVGCSLLVGCPEEVAIRLPQDATPPLATGEVPEELDLYLFIGQSNMAGYSQYSDKNNADMPDIYLLNALGQWTEARNPLNRYSTVGNTGTLSPAYSFALRMQEANNHQDHLGLIVNARPGSAIELWKRGKSCYEEAIRRIRQAMEHGTLRGVVWHQGESNASDGAYAGKLKTLIESLRHDLGIPDLPVVAGEVYGTYLVNEFISDLAGEVPFTGAASADGLAVWDGIHFDRASTVELGERLAEAMLEIQRE